MKLVRSIVILGILAAAVGCTSVRVASDYDREIDFSRYKTYDWMARTETPASDPVVDNSLLAKRIRQAVDEQMAERGYNKAAGEEADLLLTYYIGQKDWLDVTSYGHGCWHRRYGRSVEVRRYEENTLIVDIVDPSIDQLVWRGSAIEVLGPYGNLDKDFRAAAKIVMEDFPP